MTKISATIHPNSKLPRVEKDLMGILHIYVKALPLEGKANKESIKALASYLKVRKSTVFLIHGEKSKNKVFEIK